MGCAKCNITSCDSCQWSITIVTLSTIYLFTCYRNSWSIAFFPAMSNTFNCIVFRMHTKHKILKYFRMYVSLVVPLLKYFTNCFLLCSCLSSTIFIFISAFCDNTSILFTHMKYKKWKKQFKWHCYFFTAFIWESHLSESWYKAVFDDLLWCNYLEFRICFKLD